MGRPIVSKPNPKSSTNLYYVAFKNNPGQSSIPAEFSEHRDSPLAKVSSNYKMTVTYMDITLENIRYFNTASKVLSVTMTFPPDNLTSTVNLFPLPTDIYFFGQVLQAIGEAFKAATDDIISQYDAIYGPGAWAGDITKAQVYPFVDFFSGNNLFQFFNDVRNSTSGYGLGAPTPILMFLSPQLLTLFRSVMADLSTGQILFPVLPSNVNLETLAAPQVPGLYVNNLQDFDSTELWFDIQSIIVSTNSIGIRSEYLGVPYSTITSGAVASSASNLQIPILAEFNTIFDAGSNNPSTKIRYYPTAEYKWVDIESEKPLQDFDFKFYFTDREGGITPCYLGPGDSFKIQCLFSRRTF